MQLSLKEKAFSFILVLPTLICCLSVGKAEAQDNRPTDGIGVIAPERGITACHLNFPLTEFDLYDAPGGKAVARLFKKNSLNIMYLMNGTTTAYRVADEELVELESMGYCLKFYEESKGFARVLEVSAGQELWISLKDLQYLRYGATHWIDLMAGMPGVYMIQEDLGMNLRGEAKTGNNKILLVKGSHYGLIFTGNKDGLWAEVKVRLYAQTPCRDISANKKFREEWTGWMKVIDDAGFPNVWFAPACQ